MKHPLTQKQQKNASYYKAIQFSRVMKEVNHLVASAGCKYLNQLHSISKEMFLCFVLFV